MSSQARIVPIGRGATRREAPPQRAHDGLPGTVSRRSEVAAPLGYAVFDCETTGTDTALDEMVSLALVRLDPDGRETARFTTLVRPSCPIPVEATAVHGIDDEDVAGAPGFAEIADELLRYLEGAVFVAHNVDFDLTMLRRALARAGVDYTPVAVACTLDAFRLLEPLAANHRLESICERRGIAHEDAHEALGDVLATAALLRGLLADGIAPETVRLDHGAYLRLRSRGDTRAASEPQIRRVFGMARSAGLVRPDGGVDRDQVVALVAGLTGVADVDALTREQVQAVYDRLQQLIDARVASAQAASA